MRSVTIALAALGLTVLTAGSLAWAQAPSANEPVLNIPEGSLNRITAIESKQIADYISFHFNILQTAQSDQQVSQAQSKLLEGFNKYDAAGYRYAYADQSVKQAIGALTKPAGEDALAAIRQANVGLWLSSMNREAVKPALDQMIRSKNDTLRFYGWQGYKRIGVLVLAQGQRPGDEMLAAMQQAAQTENSPVVLGSLLQAVQFPLAAPTGVRPEALKNAHDKAMLTAQAAWPRLCSQLAGGNQDMTYAARSALPTIRTLAASAVGSDAANKTRLIQMIADVLHSAAVSYDEVAKGQGALADANAMVMCEAEAMLAQVSGKMAQHVSTALTNTKLPTPQDRCTEVRLAVTTWIQDLQAQGVVQPTIQAASATAPAGK